jgi:hypothetical protein
VRLDDVVRSNDVCLLKADVEGYEPQVLHTAQRLFAQRRVHALQLEMTRSTPGTTQRCATIKMLEHLDALGYAFKQVSHAQADAVALPRVGEWANADGFGRLPDFPSNATRAQVAREGLSPMRAAYERDFTAYLSTNLFARQVQWPTRAARPWPSLEC